MVRSLVRHEIKPRKSSEMLYALIMGEKGTGKTTLASELCKLRSKNSQNLISITEKENYYPIIQEKYAFVLIDTSEYEDTEEFQELMQLENNDCQIKVSTLFVILKYDTRFERMMTSYLTIEESVKEYADKIVVMISHWDYSKCPEEDFKEICEFFQEECANIVNFIFYSDQNINGELADLMFSCISNMNSNLPTLIEDEPTLHDDQNTIKILKDTSFENEIQVSEEILNRSITLTSDTKMQTSQGKTKIATTTSNKTADANNEEVQDQKSNRSDSFSLQPSDYRSTSTKNKTSIHETTVYRVYSEEVVHFSHIQRHGMTRGRLYQETMSFISVALPVVSIICFFSQPFFTVKAFDYDS